MNRGWRIPGSWTDLLVPMPFTTVYIMTGEPISIPEGISRTELGSYVMAAQQAMDVLNAEADRMVNAKQPLVTTRHAKAA